MIFSIWKHVFVAYYAVVCLSCLRLLTINRNVDYHFGKLAKV